MIYGVNAFSSVSFWDRYKVQRGSRIRREVLHTLQFRCACTIQCLYNTMTKWEGTEEEARKAQDGWYRRKGNENGRSSITCWWSSYTRWSFKKCKRILRAWVTISLPSFFLVPSPLFFIFVLSGHRQRQCQRQPRRQRRRRRRRRTARTHSRDNENASKPSLNWLLRPHKRKGSRNRRTWKGEKKRTIVGSRLENARISTFKGDIIVTAGIFIFMK